MRIRLGVICAVGALSVFGPTKAADERTLRALEAPPAAGTAFFPTGAAVRPVRFARVVVKLPPEPWAFVQRVPNGRDRLRAEQELVTWSDGQQEVKTSTVSAIFDEELRNAGGMADASTDSLFSESSDADLQVAVRISQMAGRFCQNCGSLWANGNRWSGAVTMTARWEIYPGLERKVLASVVTSGGFRADKPGLDGEPERIINEAFRDNARRLIASPEFQRVVTAPIGPLHDSAPIIQAITLQHSGTGPAPGDVVKSVAVIFAGDGSGSGFLISDEGYLLTNRHVVGGSKYVKVKWSDGDETLGEVVRSNARRDVALVKVEARGRSALVLRSGPVRQGEPVYAIGSPLGEALQNTMTRGIVSATRVIDGQPIIQSDVAVTHGNSGGPLLDEKGRVIGMTESGMAPAGSPIGLNFFIPIDDALRALALAPAPESAVAQASSPAPEPVRAAKKR